MCRRLPNNADWKAGILAHEEHALCQRRSTIVCAASIPTQANGFPTRQREGQFMQYPHTDAQGLCHGGSHTCTSPPRRPAGARTLAPRAGAREPAGRTGNASRGAGHAAAGAAMAVVNAQRPMPPNATHTCAAHPYPSRGPHPAAIGRRPSTRCDATVRCAWGADRSTCITRGKAPLPLRGNGCRISALSAGRAGMQRHRQ